MAEVHEVNDKTPRKFEGDIVAGIIEIKTGTTPEEPGKPVRIVLELKTIRGRTAVVFSNEQAHDAVKMLGLLLASLAPRDPSKSTH